MLISIKNGAINVNPGEILWILRDCMALVYFCCLILGTPILLLGGLPSPVDRTLTECMEWWCNNPSQKWWSSSMGFGWHSIYDMENNPNVWNHQPVMDVAMRGWMCSIYPSASPHKYVCNWCACVFFTLLRPSMMVSHISKMVPTKHPIGIVTPERGVHLRLTLTFHCAQPQRHTPLVPG